MARTIKKKSGLYAYLNESGVLKTNDDNLIKAAKAAYWKSYKKNWRQNQRRQNKEFCVILSSQHAETILLAAKKYHRSPSDFIRESSLAFLEKRYIVPDALIVNEIKQLLAMNINVLLQNKGSYPNTNSIVKQMEELEHEVRVKLHNPKTLEQLITETVKSSPGYKRKLIELLQKL